MSIQDKVAELEAELEAASAALAASKKAEEDRLAQAEIERIRAELASTSTPTPSAPVSRKRKGSPPTSAEPVAKQPKPKPQPSAPEEVDIDLLSDLHNQASDSEAAGEEEDSGGLAGGVGPQSAEDEEAWQRAVAAEMGIEYLTPDDRAKKEKDEQAKAKRDEKERAEKAEEEARNQVFKTKGKIEMSVEEGRALFKVYPPFMFYFILI